MVRKRVPMEIRKLEGTDRASTRRRAEDTPKVPIVTIAECPGLSKEAKKYWVFFRNMFKKFPVVAETDIAALQRLVETYAEVRVYMAVLEKDGRFITAETRHGDVMRAHPAVGALQDADRRFRAYMTDFGMTPASRTKVKGENGDEKETDPLGEFGV